MPGSPLSPGDPTRVGRYLVRGRLGAGGQGVVYLAETPDGAPVAVKMLHAADEEAAEALRREAEVLPRVAAFCTAQVIEVGTDDGLPYVVSEYITGPTLQQEVTERGPVREHELRRLAVGTITALAAIHRAGVVHRDFKPGNVLISPQGPRVIDFGIARPAGVLETTGEAVMGTPAYMAPEHFRQGPIGPAADVFAWASTVLFAASGTPPFGADSLPAIVNRILAAEPDLGPLPGDLRDVVAACLAKDPAGRPAAREVLLRLLGRPPDGAAPAETLAAGHAAARPARGPRRLLATLAPTPSRRRLLTGAVVTAVALLAATAALTAVPSGPVTVALATKGALAADARTVTVPELGATLHEHPTDPLRLTSFLRGSTDLSQGLAFSAGLRAADGDGFQPVTTRMLPVVSPDGARAAHVHENPGVALENAGAIRVTRRDLGGEFWIPVVDPPLALRRPSWAEDGRRVLVTVYDTGDDDRTMGFAIADAERRTATFVRAADSGAGKADYVWGPDGTVARTADATGGRIRLYEVDGTPRRTIDQVNQPDDAIPVFSADGRLATRCPGATDTACVLDGGTGRRSTTVPLPPGGVIWFWFGQDHLGVYTEQSSPPRLQAIDLTGRAVRTLAEFTPGASWSVHWSAR
ncbi:protein kinase domain-containing protein [Nonomuraea sp. NPDC004297]